VTEDHHPGAASRVGLGECPAECRLRTRGLQKAGRDGSGGHPLGLAFQQRESSTAIDPHRIERTTAGLPVLEIGIRRRHEPVGLIGLLFEDPHQAVDVRIGHRTQQHVVGDGVDEGRGADADRQRRDGQHRETRIAPQHARGIANVVPDPGGEGRASRRAGRGERRFPGLDPRQLLPQSRIVVQFGKRGAPGVLVAGSLRPHLDIAIVEMLSELLGDLRLASGIEAGGRQSPADLRKPVRHHAPSVPAMRLIAAAKARQALRCSPSTRRPPGVNL